MQKLNRMAVVGLVASTLVLATAPGAMAQGSAAGTYQGPGGATNQVAVSGGSGAEATDPSATADSTAGSLPFTGLDLGMALGGALLLLAAGLALSRVVVPSRVE